MISRMWERWLTLFVRIVRGVARRLNRAAETAAPTMPDLPAWVREELHALASIEPELLTPEGTTAKYAYYHVPNIPAPGQAYAELLNGIPEDEYTHVFLLPWLKPGGADRGALYHIRALREQPIPAKVLVITTEPAESPWKANLPDGVPLVELGLITRGLDFHLQVHILIRLLVQLRPPIIHIINSRCGWEAVRQCGLALRQFSRLFASLFCDEYSQQGIPLGYARDYLRSCYIWLEAVFCDNSVYPRIWAAELGIPVGIFSELPFPYDRPLTRRIWPDNVSAPRVLWAGRLDRQKRPDLLAAIAERMPHLAFDVHGAAVVSSGDAAVKLLETLPNVTMHGLFERLEDVVLESHVAYLHTTAWEGVPTILFDVAAAGVPICAPSVGGIPDFVDSEWLIPEFDNIEMYMDRLELLVNSSAERAARRDRQFEILETDRAWGTFTGRLEKVPRYLHGPLGSHISQKVQKQCEPTSSLVESYSTGR